WSWANVTPEKARKSLNQWISKRGDAVHRSKPVNNGSPAAHLIKKDELEKVIRVLKDLVRVTDEYLDQHLLLGASISGFSPPHALFYPAEAPFRGRPCALAI